ncbi:MAG: hypothetical protein PHP20_01455 [Firmicutes bacterium]|jgi:hypothetical protein|nr:hypothetical protein [Bacillota bacterium]MDD4336539.1 hypothetical protein [Bacillota bacterium]MDD4791721.1 hypothetical protein [Bacillota bacterium]
MHRKLLPRIGVFAVIISIIMLAVPVQSAFWWPLWDTEPEDWDEPTVPTEAMLSEEDPYEDDTERVLDVVLAFGLMGNVSPDGKEQASAAIERLLRVLLAYPELKFSVGVSGTLLTGLAWQGSRTLQLLRDGVARGVVEPLGTTYSEGVLASMEPWDAQLATSLGAEAVAEFVGEKPSGFWNSSGVWKQEIVVPVAVGGYTHTIIEDTIIRGSGLDMLPPNAPMRVSWGGRGVVVFQADSDFGRLVDNTLRTGSPKPVMDYLRRVYDGDKQDSAVVVYARELMAAEDDTEWEKLASLLQALADEEWIRVTTLAERVESGPPPGSVIQIADGVPRGLQAQLTKEGFRDWKSFDSDSEDLQALRALYSEIRARIHSVEAAVRKAEASGKDISAAQKLLDHSKEVFISAQYGLGRPGSGGAVSGGTNWEMGRAAYVSALAAWQCVNPTISAYQEDINRDGVDEVIMTTNTDMFVLSPIGAKLLYWHDLENGEVLVGSEIQQYSGESFVSESTAGGGLERALLDTMSGPTVSGIDLSLAEYEAKLGEGFPNASFAFRHGSTSIEKSVAAKDRALAVDYSIKSRGRIDFTVSSNFCPDMHWTRIGGKDAIVYYDPNGAAASSLRQGDSFGLVNVISGTLVRIIPDQAGDEDVPLSRVSSVLGGFGRHLDLEYRFTIAPGASAGIGFELQRGKTWPSPSAVSWIQGSGKAILAGLPTYTRACSVRQFIGGYISDMPMTTVSQAAEAEGSEPGKAMLEVEAPIPEGRYDLVATLVTGRKALIENAGSYVRGAGRHEFFPEVRDSAVEIVSGYARVGGTIAAWVAVGVGAAVVLAAVIIYLRQRKAPGA